MGERRHHFLENDLNVDNWQNWSDGRLYKLHMPLQVIGASGAKVSGFGVEGGYAFAKQSDGSWKSIATGMGGGVFCQASWDEMCDGTISANLRTTATSALALTSQMRATATEIQALGTTHHRGFLLGCGSSLQLDGSYGLKKQLVCHTGDQGLIAGAGHCSWLYVRQWRQLLGTVGIPCERQRSAHAPSLSKWFETASSGDSSNIATTWTLAAYGFSTSSNPRLPYIISAGQCLLRWLGWLDLPSVIREQLRSERRQWQRGRCGRRQVYAGYQDVPSYYPSVSENRNGGGCGPIPSKGM